MTDLVEFLLARIGDDEQRARDVPRGDTWWLDERARHPMDDPIYDLIGGGKILGTFDTDHGPYFVGTHIAAWSPERVLAECEAKRKIIEWHHKVDATSDGLDSPDEFCSECEVSDAINQWPCRTLRLLALPYAGDRGYREEWRP